MPSETEWEYACRAGSTTQFTFGDEVGLLGDYAWYAKNSSDRTHEVWQKKPNAWGLYDMHGNVSEFCADWYKVSSKLGDRVERANGWLPLYRGGSFHNPDTSCWSSLRVDGIPAEGFGRINPATIRREERGFRVVMLVEGDNQARNRVARQPNLPKKEPTTNKRNTGKKIDANVTIADPFVFPDGGATIRFRKEIVDEVARFRKISNLREDPVKKSEVESRPSLEFLHKDLSIAIIPRTVIYMNGNRIEFSERATLSGQNGYGSDYIVFLTKEATISARITKAAAPKVSLKKPNDTLEMHTQIKNVRTIHGKGIQFLSARLLEVDFHNYDFATKAWKGGVVLELVNNEVLSNVVFWDFELGGILQDSIDELSSFQEGDDV
ncbi:MAG: formylglycine-generating enzyme family protein, partial [Planctomycetes bacterium]|nr:formylglycine-generating enzyme family protein [Planctomycetota bacterium]